MNSRAIIIPVHNRRETTLACLRHLRDTGDLGRCHVIVVDDGSSDHTGEAVQSEFPHVEILRGDGNLWWTGAVALGMRHANLAAVDTICWLNDDCLPVAGALDALFAEANMAPGQVVAAACYNAETRELVPNAFLGRERVMPSAAGKSRADGLSGFCVALPRAVWTAIGLPDAGQFPHYFGDNAYTLIAARAGFPVVLLGSARANLTAFHAPPSLGEIAKSAEGWRERWDQVLVSPKSPYRLRTLFAYQRLKYGWIIGTAIALGRSLKWIAQLAWCRRRP